MAFTLPRLRIPRPDERMAPTGPTPAPPVPGEPSGYQPPEGFNQPPLGTKPLPPEAPPIVPVDYSQPGQFMSGLAPFDEAKFYGEHDSPKYQMLRVFSHFDPSQGVTPELIEALNSLGLGTFSSEGGDRLTIGGNVDPRFEGSGLADVIQDFGPGGKNLWGWGGFEGMDSPDPSSPLGMGNQIGSILSSLGLQTAPNVLGTPSPTPGTPPGMPGAPAPSGFTGDIKAKILELLNTQGGFNQGIINSRLESARTDLEGQREAELDTMRGIMADRGLLGSGSEITGYEHLGGRLARDFGARLQDIYANESENADARMMQALVTGAGMSIEEAKNAVDWFNAHTGRIGTEGSLANEQARIALQRELGLGDLDLRRVLGLGNLGLGQAQLQATYGLGLGDLSLRRELGLGGLQNQNIGNLLQIIQMLYGGAGIGSGGYV